MSEKQTIWLIRHINSGYLASWFKTFFYNTNTIRKGYLIWSNKFFTEPKNMAHHYDWPLVRKVFLDFEPILVQSAPSDLVWTIPLIYKEKLIIFTQPCIYLCILNIWYFVLRPTIESKACIIWSSHRRHPWIMQVGPMIAVTCLFNSYFSCCHLSCVLQSNEHFWFLALQLIRQKE